jgi:3-isopropylmalate/(R)-2-methylmalate dehydratase small subunit
MKQFTALKSTVIPLNLDNVDTDMIIPAGHLRSVSKEGYGEHLFSELKRLYPDFIFNNPVYAGGKILTSKDNFGCGSSREHAAWALLQAGVEVVICSSFGDIFFNNAAKNGLLLITLPSDTIEKWLNLALNDAALIMEIDLAQQSIRYAGEQSNFEYDGFRKHCLLNGQDDLDYLLSQKMEISAYEQKNSHTCR